MGNKEICKAKIESKITILYWIVFGVLLLFTVLWSAGVFGHYNPNPFTKGFFKGYALPPSITIVLMIVWIVWGIRCKIVSSRCALNLTDSGISGSRATLFSVKNLDLPIDKVDSIMRSSTLYNKLTGGNTVAIRSASGLIKFPWVQNAEEFVNATLAKIEEYKKTVKKDNQELIKAVAETAAAPANTSSASKIKEIKELLDQGLISQEEFDAKRKELLEKM